MLALLNESTNPIPGDGSVPALFREPRRALQDLEHIRGRLPEDLAASLLGLLNDSPDPDQALSLCDRLFAQGDDELIRLFDRNRVLLHYAIVVFGHSHWLGDGLLRNPSLLDSFNREKSLERSLGREDYRQKLAQLRLQTDVSDLSAWLAGFKKREYIRIALRDALGIATLAETAEEISALADVIIQEALGEAERRMRQRYGHPLSLHADGAFTEAAFTVLAMGKLGGNELNYSSDVDLLYMYTAPESSGPLSWREYFVRLAQVLTDILSCATAEGAVFRIDLRLRPQGHEGEPALSLRHVLDYYAQSAHDWELQALIKARYSAGDASLAREFIRGVQSQIYTEDLNFEAVETALLSREKIGARRLRLAAAGRTPATIDVKLDRGGIRDIEFLVQCLQRVYGGGEPWLRSGGTMFSLQKLHDKGHLSGRDFHELTVAYEFLRSVEHRLQLQRGQQAHRLPSAAVELEVLRRAVSRGRIDEGADVFLPALKSRMDRVAEIYDRVVHSQRHRRSEGMEIREITPGVSPNLSDAPLQPGSFDQWLQRVATDSPALAAVVTRSDLSLHARRALHRFLSSAMTSADRCAVLAQSPALLPRALVLLETSDYLADVLVQHPEELSLLEQLPRASPANEDFNRPFRAINAAFDLSEAMAALRRGFRKKLFMETAQDVLAPRPALNSMRETTAAGDAAVRAALHIVGGEDLLAVFALGRLGTQEFDLASDADLLFVRDAQADEDRARAAAEKLIHVLAAYTREGTIFAVDTRLRPRGGEGDLVVTACQLGRYLAEEAQPWEALTYTKLRFVAGRQDVSAVTLPMVRSRIAEMGAKLTFGQEVLEMRARLEKSNRYPRSFKLARGGFYDIDFITSFLMLRQALFRDGNTLDRLARLCDDGLLERAAFAALRQATLLYRTVDHVIRLVTGRDRPELPEAEHARHATVSLVNRILGRDSGNDLQTELAQTQETIHRTFVDLIGNLREPT
jgi:glutamate-ammonia-ligase adenylyltransferase